MTKARVRQRLVVEGDEKRGGEVAHPLQVTELQMLPNVPEENESS
jgi:hypothetical protein